MHIFIPVAIFLAFAALVSAQPALVPFIDCATPNTIPDSPNKISISHVYAQISSSNSGQRFLNFTLFGSSPGVIVGVSDGPRPLLATMFTTTSVLTFTIYEHATAFCDFLRPASPLPALNATTTNYCPLSGGPIAFSTSSPINADYELISIITRIRVVDVSSPPLELACIDISVAPIRTGVLNSIYGSAAIVFWVTVSITLGYFITVGSARIATAWNRGGGHTPVRVWSMFQRAGFVVASAISGEKLASVPALLRFCTPSLRDVMFHSQWCAALGMIAVEWPMFAYPVFVQTAWSSLAYNITFTQGADARQEHWNPLSVPDAPIPAGFSNQVDDPKSPLHMDRNTVNVLFNLPIGVHAGMESFAYSLGVRPQDLFGIALGLFLVIVAGTIVVSLLIWFTDWALSNIIGLSSHRRQLKGTRGWTLTGKEGQNDSNPSFRNDEEDGPNSGGGTQRVQSRAFAIRWWKYRIGHNSFHRDALLGNLIRILILFHLPITIFSAFQFARPWSEGTVLSVVLAVFSFIFLSLLIPFALIFRLTTMRTNKLYDDTRTLLAYGPLYNQYASGSQTFTKLFFLNNVVFGLVVGCGQRSGTAQAIIVLITEVASALWTSVYLPWGRGAAMGVVSFLFCVSRIVTGVLLVILSPTVSVGVSAGGWIAAAILIIQGLIYALLLLMLFVKILEGCLRLIFRIPFDRSRHGVDSGFLGVLSLLGLFGPRQAQAGRNQRYKLARHATDSAARSQGTPELPSAYKMTPFAPGSRGPPSVLRADQVHTPYREDGDDESGHILGPWVPFPEQQQQQQVIPPSPAAESQSSGFTRIRGGKANFNTPYAMVQPISHQPSFRRSSSEARTYELPSQSGIPFTTQMPPSPNETQESGQIRHVRTRSQTAIVGDIRTLQQPRQSFGDGRRTPGSSHSASREATQESGEGDGSGRKRRYWFSRKGHEGEDEDTKTSAWGFLKGRRRSEGDEPPPPVEGGSGSGRSFVVIRDRQPSAPTSASPLPGQFGTAGPSAWRGDVDHGASENPRSPRRNSMSSLT